MLNFKDYLYKQSTGQVDSRELRHLTRENNAKPEGKATLTTVRDGMGWDQARDISEHQLHITDEVVKGHVTVRTYRQSSLKGEKLPVLIYSHGGGFLGGSIDNVEYIARAFADKAAVLVVSVGYRLTPHNPYPAALLDIYNVAEYYYTHADKENIDPHRIYLAGDSAGGNLSITAALLDRAILKSNYIAKVLAFYPVVDLTGTARDINEYQVNDAAVEPIIYQYIKDFWGQENISNWYSSETNLANPLVSPLLASDTQLALLPPTQLITGEFDPLRLENDAFVQRLQENQVAVDYLIFPTMVHAFVDKVGDFEEAEQAVDAGAAFLVE